MSKHVVFLIGESEYRSEQTMPPISHELVTRFGMTVSVLQAKPDLTTIPGMDALDEADGLVCYLRFTSLPRTQLDAVRRYLDSKKPIVGLRTSTHAFRYDADSPLVEWNGFGERVFGAPWRYHYGGASMTDARIVARNSSDPILVGVDAAFRCRSWLYHVLPLPDDCRPLLVGTVVGETARSERVENPVAWTREADGRRVFYTSLGHPEDFAVAPFRRALLNGILWSVGEPGVA